MFRTITVLIVTSLILLGCSDDSTNLMNNRGYSSNPTEIKKKYYLRDCVVKINLLWDSSVTNDLKYRVSDNVLEEMKVAIISGEFPLFSGGMTRDSNHISIYYSDNCVKREEMSHRLIENYFSSEIKGFPEYSIDVNVKPGFDGSTPSGWWLDDA